MRRILLALAALTVIGACGPPPEVCSETNVSCPKGGTVQSCCTSVSCRYKTSDGTSIPCNGTSCSTGSPTGASTAAAWCIAH